MVFQYLKTKQPIQVPSIQNRVTKHQTRDQIRLNSTKFDPKIIHLILKCNSQSLSLMFQTAKTKRVNRGGFTSVPCHFLCKHPF